jgi:hypothetical protein
MNFVAAPYTLKFFNNLPPLNIIFWCGWHWVFPAFIFGAVPVVFMGLSIVVILGYIHAIDRGGNGTEKCPPTKIALFYSLHPEDRVDIRKGIQRIENFESFDDDYATSREPTMKGDSRQQNVEDPGSSDYSENGNVKRIPSYKPRTVTGSSKKQPIARSRQNLV